MTKPSDPGNAPRRPGSILGQLAERALTDSTLNSIAEQFAAQTKAAGEADRLTRKAGLAAVVAAVQPSPLVSVTRALAGVPLIERYAAELHPRQVATELAAGRGAAELALRHGLTHVGDDGPAPATAGELVEPVAKIVRAELSLPAKVAESVAARFVAAYLLLNFAITAPGYFAAEAIAEAGVSLENENSQVARFVRACWEAGVNE